MDLQTSATNPLIHAALVAPVRAAHAAGFTVHVPVRKHSPQVPAGHVYVTRADLPGIALIQVPNFPMFEPLQLTAAIKPSREFGSGVFVDYAPGIAGLLQAVEETLAKTEILPRFVKNPRMVAIDRRIPADAVEFTTAHADYAGTLDDESRTIRHDDAGRLIATVERDGETFTGELVAPDADTADLAAELGTFRNYTARFDARFAVYQNGRDDIWFLDSLPYCWVSLD